MLLISVVLSVSTDFHAINLAASTITVIAAVVLLNQHKLRFGDLFVLNALLLIHVLAAYVATETTMVLLALLLILYLAAAVFKKQPWFGFATTLGLTLWWLLLGSSSYWLIATLVFILYLLFNVSKPQTTPVHHPKVDH